MTSKIILSSVFAVILFAGMASAQHVKVFDGTRLGSATPSGQGMTATHVKAFNGQTGALLAPVAEASRLPILNFVAGKPIRIEISQRRGDERTFYSFAGTPPRASIAEIPCGGGMTSAQAARRGGSGTDLLLGGAGDDVLIAGRAAPRPEPYYHLTMKHVFITSLGNAGTCQLLNVRLANGVEYRGILRFR